MAEGRKNIFSHFQAIAEAKCYENPQGCESTVTFPPLEPQPTTPIYVFLSYILSFLSDNLFLNIPSHHRSEKIKGDFPCLKCARDICVYEAGLYCLRLTSTMKNGVCNYEQYCHLINNVCHFCLDRKTLIYRMLCHKHSSVDACVECAQISSDFFMIETLFGSKIKEYCPDFEILKLHELGNLRSRQFFLSLSGHSAFTFFGSYPNVLGLDFSGQNKQIEQSRTEMRIKSLYRAPSMSWPNPFPTPPNITLPNVPNPPPPTLFDTAFLNYKVQRQREQEQRQQARQVLVPPPHRHHSYLGPSTAPGTATAPLPNYESFICNIAKKKKK